MKKHLSILFHALVISTVNYGLIAWDSASDTILRISYKNILRPTPKKPSGNSTKILYEEKQKRKNNEKFLAIHRYLRHGLLPIANRN